MILLTQDLLQKVEQWKLSGSVDDVQKNLERPRHLRTTVKI